MFSIEVLFFLCFLSVVHTQRYYAFVETLFVIDQNYFPRLSSVSYEDYVQTMVDTTNIVFQSQNDLDVKIEMIVSKVMYLNIIQPRSQQPYVYAEALRQQVPDYDKYDTIVLLSYQPWEGSNGAQGYAMVKGVCHPQHKIMYVLPYQNAPFYLAHEFGHQLGLVHQVDTPCYTSSYMSVMTRSHTVSYEQARWTKCENDWINKHICEFECLFNKPENYQLIKNKYSTLPGKKMNNDQQAKMIEQNQQVMGEVNSFTYMQSESASRCLYFQSYTGEANGAFRIAFTPMLPGSTCGDNSICHFDKCVSMTELDSSVLNPEYETNTLDLKKHCTSGGDPDQLKSSNHDPHPAVQCINWESDFLCQASRSCPSSDDSSAGGLYMNHLCCEKCSPKSASQLSVFGSYARTNQNSSKILLRCLLFFYLFSCLH